MDENVPHNSACGSGPSASSGSQSTGSCPEGCQCEINNSQCTSNAVTSLCPTMNVNVYPTTGGHFQVRVSSADNTEQLKKLIAKKLKVAKERICLLHKEKELREGSLRENGVQDGSSITLLPMVETGLFTQKPEQSVLQALESLSDVQVNDFLSGKSPLNLAMRLGDHMMFIQLQLSTVGTALTRTKALPPKTPATGGNSPAMALSAAPKMAQVASRSSATASPPAPPQRLAQPLPTLTAPSAAGADAGSSQVGPKAAPSSACSHRGLRAAGPPPRPCLSPNPASSTGCPGHRQQQQQQRHLTDVTHLLDTRTLAEASRNLSQTLRHLSSQALNNSRAESEECSQSYRSQGAIIESMHHHGRGVFSGTFSGTLNPALQDRHGQPKRDISTIVHILNDLLEATPQYRRQHGGGEAPSVVRVRSPPKAVGGQAIENAISKSQEEYSRLSLENEATRGKMEQLQLMLEERRARRRARRVTHAPYPSSWSVPATSGLGNTPAHSALPFVETSPESAQEAGMEANANKIVGEAASEIKSDRSISGSSPGDAETPMECDAPEGAMASDAGSELQGENAAAATNEYLKLNPETVVA